MEFSNQTHEQNINRGTVIQLIVSALQNNKIVFGRELAQKWLSSYPGDLTMQYYLALFYQKENKMDLAIKTTKKLIEADPEYLSAHEFYTTLSISEDEKDLSLACIHILGGVIKNKSALPAWSPALRVVKKSIGKEKFENAGDLMVRVLSLKLDNPIINLFHLKSIYFQHDSATIRNLSEIYYRKWPKTILYKLILAEQFLESGEEEEAVNLLHECVADDAAGQVARRLWGDQHVFLPLWPEVLSIRFDFQVPGEVASDMGWNRLPEGKVEVSHYVFNSQEDDQSKNFSGGSRSKAFMEAEKEFQRIAKSIKKDYSGKLDGRFPVYVIMTTKTGLVQQYGEQTYNVISQSMAQINLVMQKKPGWDSLIFIPDDNKSQQKLNLAPITVIDPWKIKLAIHDLDKVLAKRGERIGALIIVGGNEVVPFHRLPNPTDDVDDDIMSDNPYGSLDNNYFVTNWPLGRIIGEKGQDAGLLIQQLRQIVKFHMKPKSVNRVWDRIVRSFTDIFTYKYLSSFGYSASVWKRSSATVYKSLGETRLLHTSPNGKKQSLSKQDLVTNDFGYFNLHGLVDRPEWFGQRDFLDPPGNDYPVALTPEDLLNNGKSPKVVLTEACYGGHVFGKNENESIALKYLSLGTNVVVGSTSTSYGSVAPPLIAADLFAQLFWQHIREGYLVGECFQRAKISFVQEMMKRQGYLDGEDQKTLIQFVYYGDPFFIYEGKEIQMKRVNLIDKPEKIRITSDHKNGGSSVEISDSTMAQVKSTLKSYLPGIDHADVKMNKIQIGGSNSGSLSGPKRQTAKVLNDKFIVTVRNPIQIDKGRYYQIARVTMDKKGAVLKLAMSR
jgi:tetratricopeptide (TPR) repeat protein